MITTTLQNVIALAQTHRIIPVVSELLADTETPVSVYLKLFSQEPYSFLLESVSGEESVSRYSFLSGNPFMLFSSIGTSWTITGAQASAGTTAPLEKLRELMAQYHSPSIEGMPPFTGGAVGFFGYDSVRLQEKIPCKNPPNALLPDLLFGFYRDVIVFDSRQHKILLMSAIFTHEATDINSAYADAVRRLGTLEDRLAVRLTSTHLTVKSVGELRSTFKRTEYEKAVDSCKEYIRAGDIFQVVLSQRFEIPVDANPFDLYRVLRTVNPSPYMFYLSCNDTQVVGASPEMLVRVHNSVVEARPIAGTCKRGATLSEDAALEKTLLADPKEIAEHVMLVDLGRNDIGRISEYGSVKVEDPMHIERYSHVMHIVSNVKGQLKKEHDALDALYACFPAGTLSGAPKIRAMEIIDELEPTRRGLYGGALGYIDWSGNLDSCIVIRTIIYKDKVAYIQAGAGLVADSVPSQEFEETMNKAGALFAAIKHAAALA